MYFGDIEVPSAPVLANGNYYCTARFHKDEIISMGVEYEADVFGEMIDFRQN